VVSEPKLEVHPVPQRQVVLEGPLRRGALDNQPTDAKHTRTHARGRDKRESKVCPRF
jgi:hypothetical protein